jgi:hypothetical protein
MMNRGGWVGLSALNNIANLFSRKTTSGKSETGETDWLRNSFMASSYGFWEMDIRERHSAVFLSIIETGLIYFPNF